jgi:hypothetical protein
MLPFLSPAGVVFTNAGSSAFGSLVGFFFSLVAAAAGAGVFEALAANLAAFSSRFASFFAKLVFSQLNWGVHDPIRTSTLGLGCTFALDIGSSLLGWGSL